MGLAATKEFASEQDCLGFCACVQWFCQNQILALIPYVIKVDMWICVKIEWWAEVWKKKSTYKGLYTVNKLTNLRLTQS